MVAITVTVPEAVVLREDVPLMVAPVVPASTTVQEVIVLLLAFAGVAVPLRLREIVAVALLGPLVISVTGIKAPPGSVGPDPVSQDITRPIIAPKAIIPKSMKLCLEFFAVCFIRFTPLGTMD